MQEHRPNEPKLPATNIDRVVKSIPEIPQIARTIVSHKTIVRQDWRNRLFNDFNGLATKFDDCDFRYSIFERGYFRDAQFTSCQFVGAKFKDCNLKGANFYRCDFKFARFERCILDVREMVASLPSEPNIRRDALQNLRANAAEMGDYSSQGFLVLQEVEAMKQHYRYALRGYDTYYRNKYDTALARGAAGLKLIFLQLGGLVWGHGERPWRLLLSCFGLLTILSLMNFWSVHTRIGWTETRAGFDVFKYSIQLFLDMNPDSKFRGFSLIDYAIVMMRYVYIGLFISILYKSISHR